MFNGRLSRSCVKFVCRVSRKFWKVTLKLLRMKSYVMLPVKYWPVWLNKKQYGPDTPTGSVRAVNEASR